MPTSQSLGGKVRAEQQRSAALAAYYANPNICEHCKQVIEVAPGQKVASMREKRFCNQSCAAKFRNASRKGIQKYCAACSRPIQRHNELCGSCERARRKFTVSMTKGELFARRSTYQSARSHIKRHANEVYTLSGKPQFCAVCGYTTHVEICHIRSVASFGDATTLAEINAPDNLIALCPNHHWEYDNGLLPLT
jgi:HNH endonuclease/MYM-type Zinc finger with FCS sequence motif